jgi:DedD protein
MKIELSEQVKHRLTGLVVVLSIAVIFLPAMMKKQGHHPIENMTLSVKLPHRPIPPKVTITSEKALFHSVKVAHVELPPVVTPPPVSQLAFAEPLNIPSVVPSAPRLKTKALMLTKVKKVRPLAPKVLAHKKIVQRAVTKKTAKVALPHSAIYAVQLGAFSDQDNAKSLVQRLRSKGYAASYRQLRGKQGAVYQVIVGQAHQKKEADHLKQQLAQSLQLHGFIVKKGVA